jgi:hypothetical protein
MQRPLASQHGAGMQAKVGAGRATVGQGAAPPSLCAQSLPLPPAPPLLAYIADLTRAAPQLPSIPCRTLQCAPHSGLARLRGRLPHLERRGLRDSVAAACARLAASQTLWMFPT